MGVGGDMYRDLGIMATVGFIVCALGAIAAVGGLAYVVFRGFKAVIGG